MTFILILWMNGLPWTAIEGFKTKSHCEKIGFKISRGQHEHVSFLCHKDLAKIGEK